ncbi:MAG: Holliday junction branch migration protein RuvA [Pirellulales bacterium]|nr:Holliday junction branch migration protein RuvA [Pirellulales bacterium]
MITKIRGTIAFVGEEILTLSVGAFDYEVLIPEFVRRRLQGELGREIELHTIQYLEGNSVGNKLTPRLVGFLSDVEREFFDMICQVDGVGVKKALRAMVRAVREVATAIEEQDQKTLAALPGIGPATAERMIAKLRRKMPKFALLVARDDPATATDAPPDVMREAFDALLSLGHAESDARRLLDKALAGKKKFKDVQELLLAVYEGNKK